MLSFFYMHKSGYLIKFAFPVSKNYSCPQNPFQSSKSLSSLQNHSVSCKMNLDDDKGKVGKAVFRRDSMFHKIILLSAIWLFISNGQESLFKLFKKSKE